MPEKSLEERVKERTTDSALALLAVEITTLNTDLNNALGIILDRLNKLEKAAKVLKKEFILHTKAHNMIGTEE